MLLSLQFGHAWAAWMDVQCRRQAPRRNGASIRPRLGSVDGRHLGRLLSNGATASIRPRLGSVDGRTTTFQSGGNMAAASIRPRLGSVDGPKGQALVQAALDASIRPRLGSVDGRPGRWCRGQSALSFNSATPGQRGWTRVSPSVSDTSSRLQFGHAWAAWMDKTRFFNAVAAKGGFNSATPGQRGWTRPPSRRLPWHPASIRPRLGSVDGLPASPSGCSRTDGFNSATPGQRGWTR